MRSRKSNCKHTCITKGCPCCLALQKKWYAKLADEEFQDIEYGMENPRFTAQRVNASAPDAESNMTYYERVWQVYHLWTDQKRPKRDLRLCELYATQEGDSGTVRGISRVLRAENLSPWSTSRVQKTLKQIRELVQSGAVSNNENVIETGIYIRPRYAAA